MFYLKGRLLPCLKLSLASIVYSGHFYTFKFLTSTRVQLFGDQQRVARFVFCLVKTLKTKSKTIIYHLHFVKLFFNKKV